MMFGLVNANFSLPEWQAVKLTFFVPCNLFFFFYTQTRQLSTGIRTMHEVHFDIILFKHLKKYEG